MFDKTPALDTCRYSNENFNLFESGMCGVRLTQARQGATAPDSFGLATIATMAPGAASTVGTCAVQFLRVPDAIVTTAAGVATNPRRVCGGLLSSQNGEAQSGAIDSKYIHSHVLVQGKLWNFTSHPNEYIG